MKYKIICVISGIIFTIGLAVLSYLSFALGVALAFSGNDWFINLMFVFAVLAIANIVGLCLLKKKPIVEFIICVISVIAILFEVTYLFAFGGATASGGVIVFFIAEIMFGLITATFSYLTKRKNKSDMINQNIEE